MNQFTAKYRDQVQGVISGFDRLALHLQGARGGAGTGGSRGVAENEADGCVVLVARDYNKGSLGPCLGRGSGHACCNAIFHAIEEACGSALVLDGFEAPGKARKIFTRVNLQ